MLKKVILLILNKKANLIHICFYSNISKLMCANINFNCFKISDLLFIKKYVKTNLSLNHYDKNNISINS